jgi:hypothetical protein
MTLEGRKSHSFRSQCPSFPEGLKKFNQRKEMNEGGGVTGMEEYPSTCAASDQDGVSLPRGHSGENTTQIWDQASSWE